MAEWTDLDAMLNDIARHTRKTGDEIINADSPPFIRFVAYKPNGGEDDYSDEWVLRTHFLSSEVNRIEARDPMRGSILRQAFSTAAGRQRIAQSFPKPGPNGVEPAPSRFEREDPI